jgi:hypothetical protein
VQRRIKSEAALRVAIVAVALLLSACTTPRAVAPVDTGEPKELHLKAGDSIRVVTKDRERLSFEITEIRPNELAGVTRKPAKHETRPEGEPVVVPYENLAFVVVRRFSPSRTAVAVPVAVLLVAAGVVIEAGGFAVMPAAAP